MELYELKEVINSFGINASVNPLIFKICPYNFLFSAVVLCCGVLILWRLPNSRILLIFVCKKYWFCWLLSVFNWCNKERNFGRKPVLSYDRSTIIQSMIYCVRSGCASAEIGWCPTYSVRLCGCSVFVSAWQVSFCMWNAL